MTKIDPKPASPSIKDPAKQPRASVKTPSEQTVLRRYGDVLIKLERLRSATRDLTRAYTANLERDILEIMDLVRSVKAPERPEKKKQRLHN
ncbi:MAG: hypothetical protein HY579_13150 [Nitrospinae bacterium]|nr:hypothetical protein [Nitrospinota bacterium]